MRRGHAVVCCSFLALVLVKCKGHFFEWTALLAATFSSCLLLKCSPRVRSSRGQLCQYMYAYGVFMYGEVVQSIGTLKKQQPPSSAPAGRSQKR